MHCIVRLLGKTVRYFFIYNQKDIEHYEQWQHHTRIRKLAYGKILRSLKNICGQQCQRAAPKKFQTTFLFTRRETYSYLISFPVTRFQHKSFNNIDPTGSEKFYCKTTFCRISKHVVSYHKFLTAGQHTPFPPLCQWSDGQLLLKNVQLAIMTQVFDFIMVALTNEPLTSKKDLVFK